MAKNSKIEWTESTWNPITGCEKISEGCKNCYAEKMAYRLKAMGIEKYKNEFNVTIHPDLMYDPLKWKKSKMIFVCSMSDIFHKKVPDDFILSLFETMNKAHQHIFQVLTKRPDRFLELNNKINWTNNIWLGVTIESQKYIERLDKLIQSKAKTKYLSLEPLLTNIDFEKDKLEKIDWIIVGGESGINARPIKIEWVRNIKQQCQDTNIPFFFKQWGGKNKKENGRLLDGVIWDEKPKVYSTLLC